MYNGEKKVLKLKIEAALFLEKEGKPEWLTFLPPNASWHSAREVSTLCQKHSGAAVPQSQSAA